jgi:hypothetical protein
MVGRAGLIFVIGFAFILGLTARNLNRFTIQSEGNMAAYVDGTLSHNLALAGANVAITKFYQDRTWSGSISESPDLPGMHGSFTATLTNSGSAARLISVSSYSTWWASGGTISDTVIAFFSVNDSSSFAQYAWLTGFSGNDQFWYGGDTVWGPVRSNGGLHMGAGTEVFNGKVLLAKNITGPGNPIYMQGPPVKTVGVSFPPDLSIISSNAAAGGKVYSGDVQVTFRQGSSAGGDGFAVIRSASSGALVDSFAITPSGFNGAVWVNGNVYMTGGSGRVDGRLTIGSAQSIYIEGGGIRYEQDPLAGPSDDVLGLCATNSIIIGKSSSATDPANWPSCRIDAAMFALKGSFSANTPGGTGLLTTVGAVIEGSKGTIMGSNGKDGYVKRYHWDGRFADPANIPPFFPGFGPKTYHITNWWESGRHPVAYHDE